MRGIRCYGPRIRPLFGIESAALSHAADSRVLGPLTLAYQRDVDGCADACFVCGVRLFMTPPGQDRALALPATTNQSVSIAFDLASSSYSSDSSTNRLGRQIYYYRASTESARGPPPPVFASSTRLSLDPGSLLMAVPLKARKVGVTAQTSTLKACRALPHAHTDPRPTTRYCYSALVPTPIGPHPMPVMVYADDGMVVTGDHVDMANCLWYVLRRASWRALKRPQRQHRCSIRLKGTFRTLASQITLVSHQRTHRCHGDRTIVT